MIVGQVGRQEIDWVAIIDFDLGHHGQLRRRAVVCAAGSGWELSVDPGSQIRIPVEFLVDEDIMEDEFGGCAERAEDSAMGVVADAEGRGLSTVDPAREARERGGVADGAGLELNSPDARPPACKLNGRKWARAEVAQQRCGGVPVCARCRVAQWRDARGIFRLPVGTGATDQRDGPARIGAETLEVNEPGDHGVIEHAGRLARKDPVERELKAGLHAPDRTVAAEGELAMGFAALGLDRARRRGTGDHRFHGLAVAAVAPDEMLKVV